MSIVPVVRLVPAVKVNSPLVVFPPLVKPYGLIFLVKMLVPAVNVTELPLLLPFAALP